MSGITSYSNFKDQSNECSREASGGKSGEGCAAECHKETRMCVETKASANGNSFDDLTREGHGMNINIHKVLLSY